MIMTCHITQIAQALQLDNNCHLPCILFYCGSGKHMGHDLEQHLHLQAYIASARIQPQYSMHTRSMYA